MKDSGVHERLSAVEVDVKHIDTRVAEQTREIGWVKHELKNGLSEIRSVISTQNNDFKDQILRQNNETRELISKQRQPVTAYAGLAAVILTLVFAFVAPLKDSDKELKAADLEIKEALKLILTRELDDAYSRGISDQKFDTIQNQINSAINNRRDIDAKHVASDQDIRRQIVSDISSLRREMIESDRNILAQLDTVSHSVNNGLGRRIDEKIEPIIQMQHRNTQEIVRLRDKVMAGN